MKKNIKFVDNANNLVSVNLDTERDYISLTGNFCDSGFGQIYDDIEPRTDLQRELVEAWQEQHRKNNEASVVEGIATLMDKVQKEQDDFYASLLQGDDYPSIDDEDACFDYLVYQCGYDNDDAACVLAVIKANDYNLRVIPYVEIGEGFSYQQVVTIFGVDYQVCKEDRIDDIAREYLECDDELWREAVYSGNTTQGLSKWIEDAINIDGALSVLGWREIDTIAVYDTNYLVAVYD